METYQIAVLGAGKVGGIDAANNISSSDMNNVNSLAVFRAHTPHAAIYRAFNSIRNGGHGDRHRVCVAPALFAHRETLRGLCKCLFLQRSPGHVSGV